MRFVYVASRGRPESSTLRLMRANEIDHVAVVEPHERADYLAAGARRDQLVTLPDRDRGLAFARQWILDDARQAGHEWYWNLDDDIQRFYTAAASRTIKTTARLALKAAEEILDQEEWGQAAIEYQQFAWSARRPLVENSYCDVAVAVRTDLDDTIAFREEAGLKVDRDFTLQVLTGGHRTVRVTRVAFGAPTIGSNAGGLQEVYQQGREQDDSEWMEQTWPGLATAAVKPNGRWDAKIDWRKAAA